MSSDNLKQKNLSLFDDSDDSDDQDESSAQQFELAIADKLNRSERKTSKLIELQSKFAYDSRFKIDDRFLDDEDDEGEVEQDQNSTTDEIQAEKSKNLAILEQVLGKTIRHEKPIDAVAAFRSSKQQLVLKKRKTNFPATSVLTPRFDPTREETKIYEITTENARKRKVNIDFDELDRRDAAAAAGKKRSLNDTNAKATGNVTAAAAATEKYYEVSDNLRETFATTEDFALGSFFGFDRHRDDEDQTQNDDENDEIRLDAKVRAANDANERATYEPIGKSEKMKNIKTLRNPFRYDSSSDDDEDVDRTKWNENDHDNDDDDEEEEEEDNEEAEEEEGKNDFESNLQSKKLFQPIGSDKTGDNRFASASSSLSLSSALAPPSGPGFKFFLPTINDHEDRLSPFYSEQLVAQAIANGKRRSIEMMRALGARKRAAAKNRKSDDKFAEKRKLLRRMRNGKRRTNKFHHHHNHQHHARNGTNRTKGAQKSGENSGNRRGIDGNSFRVRNNNYLRNKQKFLQQRANQTAANRPIAADQ